MINFAILALCMLPQSTQDTDPKGEPTPVQSVRRNAEALLVATENELTRQFLAATKDLPADIPTRVVYWNQSTRKALLPAEAEALDEAEREPYARHELGEQFYYNTLYGTPVAYARVLDLLAEHGVNSVNGKRLLDFGYGNIGHLRLLASIGAHVVGVDIDELLETFYREPSDTGIIARSDVAPAGANGSIKLVTGQFPATPKVIAEVGGDFDLITSKNVLKLGYIHPEREPNPPAVIHLGVDDKTFLAAIHRALVPQGLFAIYNIYPKQLPPDEGYLAWATGDCPWTREQIESAGFEVLAFNVNDDRPTREMAVRLGWDKEPFSMDIEAGTFATYTILRRAD